MLIVIASSSIASNRMLATRFYLVCYSLLKIVKIHDTRKQINVIDVPAIGILNQYFFANQAYNPMVIMLNKKRNCLNEKAQNT
jgi:hypothetical protein